MRKGQRIIRSGKGQIPDVATVRQCIEHVQREDIRNCLKFIYIVGAARVIEAVGRLAPNDATHIQPYGPKGTDVQLTEYQPKIPKWAQVTLSQKQLDKAFKPVPVALFTVKIAKKKLEEKEQPQTRTVALPLPREYEPWTQDLVDLFKRRNTQHVFPLTRQQIWYHITEKEPVFNGLVYPIEKYYLTKKGEIETIPTSPHPNALRHELAKELTETEPVLAHRNPFKLHALRHLRVKELIEDFNFTGLDLIAYVGWAISQARRGTGEAIPTQVKTYGRVYDNWKMYFPKLLGE